MIVYFEKHNTYSYLSLHYCYFTFNMLISPIVYEIRDVSRAPHGVSNLRLSTFPLYIFIYIYVMLNPNLTKHLNIPLVYLCTQCILVYVIYLYIPI